MMSSTQGKLPTAAPESGKAKAKQADDTKDESSANPDIPAGVMAADDVDKLTPEEMAEFRQFQKFRRMQNDGVVIEDSTHQSSPGGSGIAFKQPQIIVQDTREIKGLVYQRNRSRNRTGEPYVNMLNTHGMAVPVQALFVRDKLVEGYQFIEGESAVAAKAHKQGPVAKGGTVAPRTHPKPSNLDEATMLWQAAVKAGPHGPISVSMGQAMTPDAEAEAIMKALGIPVVSESTV